jgi:hypothetical protein
VVDNFKPGSDLSIPIIHRDGVGTLLSAYAMHMLQQVVKASSGHFPQPFLIRDVLRTVAKVKGLLAYFQIGGAFFLNILLIL